MLFKSKASHPHIILYADGQEIYNGRLSELPIREDVILSKSIHFFDDPEPCHIHRSAVRLRLTEEIQQECQKDLLSPPGPRLSSYADFSRIDTYLLSAGK